MVNKILNAMNARNTAAVGKKAGRCWCGTCFHCVSISLRRISSILDQAIAHLTTLLFFRDSLLETAK
jgi:hypothetical protein